MKKIKLKLWHKSLLALGIVGGGFGGTIGSLYAYSKIPKVKGFVHHTSRSLENNLHEFKNIEKYKTFFQDPITSEKIANYDYKRDSINEIPFKEWLFNYQTKHKETPILIVRGGPVEFRNFYPGAIFPRTFILFVEWFSKEIPWGPDLASLSFFQISKGISDSPDGRVTLGSYNVAKQITKRIIFSPDSFFGVDAVKTMLIKLFEDPITKEQIPALIKSINKTNEKMKGKYGIDVWKDHVIRLYSLQQEGTKNKYYPIFSKIADLIYKIEKESPIEVEKISDIDVEWDENTMVVKTISRDSYKINFDKSLAKIQIWKSLFGKNWKGLSFEWLKYVTHHEYGHMQTMGFVQSSANKFVGSQVPGTSPNSLNGYDIDEINRYFKARVPQIRALRISSGLIKRENKWDWNFYEDRLNEWKIGKLKVKPDERDFDQFAFEYKQSDKWIRETAEKVFGNQIDPTNPKKAPYEINLTFSELLAKYYAGEWPRFLVYPFAYAKIFSKFTKLSIATLFIMNAFDSLPATKNPTFMGSYKTLSEENKFENIDKNIENINAYNGVKLLLGSERGRGGISKYVFSTSFKIYKINPLARDKEGNLVSERFEELKIFLSKLKNSYFKYVAGANHILPRNFNEMLKSINTGTSNQINKLWSHYYYNFAEVLTRDWVQITQTLKNEAKFNYNYKLFPIGGNYLGLETFLDGSQILDYIYNKKTNKTYKQLILNPFAIYDKSKSIKNVDYKIDFIQSMFNNLNISKDKENKVLANFFPPTELKINHAKPSPSSIEISEAVDEAVNEYNLAILNIRKISVNKKSVSTNYISDLYNYNYSNDRLSSWQTIKSEVNSYFLDRFLRAKLVSNSREIGTSTSWVLYDINGDPVKYSGSLTKIKDGLQVTTRPEAYWTFFLRARGVGLRNISSIWLSPERDAVSIWGYIPIKYTKKDSKELVKYLQFKNLKGNKLFKIPIRFNVDNLFYYAKSPGTGDKKMLRDEGFTSWSVDYVSMGTWINSQLKNGDYQINFIDNNGKIIDIKWLNKRITMTGNGNMKTNSHPKKTNHIVSLNWYSQIFTPIYIKQNSQGKDIIYIRNEFPI